MDAEEKLDIVNRLRADIAALDMHIDYLKEQRSSMFEIGESVDERRNLITKLDKLMGYEPSVQ